MPHAHRVLAAALVAATSFPALAAPDVYAVTTGNRLVRFGAATPGTITDIAAVTRNAEGQVVAGSLHDAVEARDIWTFVRDTRAQTPDWQLEETDEG